MGLREKIERIMVAITFAEAGEHDTAREIMNREKRMDQSRRVDRRSPRKELRAPSIRR